MQQKIAKILFPLVLVFILFLPFINASLGRFASAIAVLSGVFLSLVFGNPYAAFMKKATAKLLTWSIVGLGFGMNLLTVLHVGLHGILFTIVSIVGVLFLGICLGRLLKNTEESALLITVGTAICGGSAIAAVAPVIHAKHENVSLALAVVFVLNAVALFVFPFLGHCFHLTQAQFGLWSALAIQDTSSVVGATLQYGRESLMVGTTVKLTRALWIVPMTLGIAFWYARKTRHETEKVKAKKPWFILGFLLAAALVTYLPSLHTVGEKIHSLATQTLVMALFFIGASLSRDTLKELGFRPFLQGFLLWVLLASSSLLAITGF